jgi:hypothetical protein
MIIQAMITTTLKHITMSTTPTMKITNITIFMLKRPMIIHIGSASRTTEKQQLKTEKRRLGTAKELFNIIQNFFLSEINFYQFLNANQIVFP